MLTGGSLKMPRGGHYQCRFTAFLWKVRPRESQRDQPATKSRLRRRTTQINATRTNGHDNQAARRRRSVCGSLELRVHRRAIRGDNAGAFTLLWYRYVAVTLILLLYLAARGRLRFGGWRDVGRAALVGVLAHAVWLVAVLEAIHLGIIYNT